MKKLFYPAIFQTEDVGYSVWLYDIKGVISQGDTIDEAVENIVDALGLFSEEIKSQKAEFPTATNPSEIRLEKGQFVAFVGFDWLEYQKKHSRKSVKKTLSIPSWLNTIAEDQHVNFSGVLQEALQNKLDI